MSNYIQSLVQDRINELTETLRNAPINYQFREQTTSLLELNIRILANLKRK